MTESLLAAAGLTNASRPTYTSSILLQLGSTKTFVSPEFFLVLQNLRLWHHRSHHFSCLWPVLIKYKGGDAEEGVERKLAHTRPPDMLLSQIQGFLTGEPSTLSLGDTLILYLTETYTQCCTINWWIVRGISTRNMSYTLYWNISVLAFQQINRWPCHSSTHSQYTQDIERIYINLVASTTEEKRLGTLGKLFSK